MKPKLASLLLLFLVLVPTCSAEASSRIIVNQASVGLFDGLSSTAISDAADTKSFYYHASVGNNIGATAFPDSGLNLIRDCSTEDWCVFPGEYSRNAFYESAYYNSPPYQDKIDIFQSYVEAHISEYDYVGMQLCFVDQQADVNEVITRWGEIEDWVESQGKKMIWWTMPVVNHNLSWFPEWARPNIENFNNQLREYCATNTNGHCEILFDLADIESHDPDGNPYTESTSYGVIESLYPGYSADGGHLDDASNAGRIRVAQAYWVLMAELSGHDATAVEVANFHAQGDMLVWQTASEIDLLMFNMHRSDTEDGTYSIDGSIPAQNPGGVIGADYTWSAYSGKFYKLEAVEANGASNMFGPVRSNTIKYIPLIMIE